MSSFRRARELVGDLFCGDVDIDAWKAKNRAPLYPEGWNRWVLLRTTEDNPSLLDLERTTRAVLAKWFELVDFTPGSNWGGGKIDNITIEPLEGGWQTPPKNRVVKHRDDLDPLPMLRPGGSTAIAVEFVYRGAARDMPWPVHKAQMVNPWCPVDADWMLWQVEAPKIADVPKEETATDVVQRHAKAALNAITPNPIGLVVFGLATLGVIVISRTVRGGAGLARAR